MATSVNLDEIVVTALAKKVKASSLPAGEYNLKGTKVTIALDGVMRKNTPEFRTPTVNIPLKTVFALCLQKCGIVEGRLKEIVIESMQEALRLGEKGDEHIEPYIKNYELWEEEVKSTLAQLDKVEVEGKLITSDVSTNITVEPGPELKVIEVVTPVTPVTITDKTEAASPKEDAAPKKEKKSKKALLLK